MRNSCLKSNTKIFVMLISMFSMCSNLLSMEEEEETSFQEPAKQTAKRKREEEKGCDESAEKIDITALTEDGVLRLEKRVEKAIKLGDMQLLQSYLARGISIDRVTRYSDPLIAMAARYRQPVLVEWLLERGAHPDYVDIGGVSALGYALKYENYEMVRNLIRHGASITHEVMREAVWHSIDVINWLIEQGGILSTFGGNYCGFFGIKEAADEKEKEQFAVFPWLMLQGGAYDICRVIYQHPLINNAGCDLASKLHPIVKALAYEQIDFVLSQLGALKQLFRLIRDEKTINALNDALILAAAGGHMAVVLKILSFGLDVIRPESVFEALRASILRKHQPILKILLGQLPQDDALVSTVQKLLILAIAQRGIESVEHVLEFSEMRGLQLDLGAALEHLDRILDAHYARSSSPENEEALREYRQVQVMLQEYYQPATTSSMLPFGLTGQLAGLAALGVLARETSSSK